MARIASPQDDTIWYSPKCSGQRPPRRPHETARSSPTMAKVEIFVTLKLSARLRRVRSSRRHRSTDSAIRESNGSVGPGTGVESIEEGSEREKSDRPRPTNAVRDRQDRTANIAEASVGAIRSAPHLAVGWWLGRSRMVPSSPGGASPAGGQKKWWAGTGLNRRHQDFQPFLEHLTIRAHSS